MADIVLVHGGFHGGWCWSRVTKLLREKECNVFAPSLTGCGDRRHLTTADTGLLTHVRDIVSLIECEELTDVVLCGHSYAGMVITGVADAIPERIRHLVYLDAPIPLDGQSNVDILATTDQAVPSVFRDLAKDFDGISVPPIGFTPDLFGITDPSDAAWISRRLTPHPLKCFEEPLPLTGQHAAVASKTYLRAKLFSYEYSKVMIKRYENDPTWHIVEWDIGHDVMILDPEAVAALLTSPPASP